MRGTLAAWLVLLAALQAATAWAQLPSITVVTAVQSPPPPPTLTCGPNDARRFGLIPSETGLSLNDSAPLLLMANADAATTIIHVDRFNPRGRTLNILTSITLTKPLVLGTFLPVYLGPGVTLTLRQQPVLARTLYFQGPGKVRLLADNPSQEFWVLPEWWLNDSDSNALDAASAACAAPTRCKVVLSGAKYLLSRPWVVTPNIVPWTSPVAEFNPTGGNQRGIEFAAGTYDPTRRITVPRLVGFKGNKPGGAQPEGWAIKINNVVGLNLYAHNLKLGETGVWFAPKAGTTIKNTVVEVPVVASQKNIFHVQPTGPGATLDNVYARSYLYTTVEPGEVALTRFSGKWVPRLVNVTLENSEVNGGSPQMYKPKLFYLKNEVNSSVVGLTYRAPSWCGGTTYPWYPISGRFDGLTSTIKVTKDLVGNMLWVGNNNTLDWGGLNRVKSYNLLEAEKPGFVPTASDGGTSNSVPVALPLFTGVWEAGAQRTFYFYHQLASGSLGNGALSLGPWIQTTEALRFVNPGIVVDSVKDVGATKKYQIEITLRNVSGRSLTSVDFTMKANGLRWPVPQQWQLYIGVRPIR